MALFDIFKTKSRASQATVPELARNVTTPVLSGGYSGSVTSMLSLLQNSSEYRLATESGVFGLPAAWRAVNLIANSVALMLVGADCYQGDSPVETHPLVSNPNKIYNGSYEFWFEAVSTALMHGNYIAIKNMYDLDGIPTEVIPVHPLNVECKLTPSGPLYKIADDLYTQDEIIHVRGLTVVGQWWGLGVVEAQRNALIGSIDMQAFSNNTYRTGAVPSVVINVAARTISQETLDQIKSDWIAAHGSGQRTPVVVPEGMSVTPIAWTPEDSQFLEARQFNIAETAFMFGLDPTDLSATFGSSGNSQTYANIEQRNIARIESSYGPWLNRFEQAWSKALPEGMYVKGNPEALLRTDVKTRYESHQLALTMGLYDEAYAQDIENIPQANRPEKKPEPQPLPVTPAITQGEPMNLKDAA